MDRSVIHRVLGDLVAEGADLLSKPRYQFEPYLIHLQGERDNAQRALAVAQQRHQDATERLAELVGIRERLQLEHRQWKEALDLGLHAARWTAGDMTSRRDHLTRLLADIDDGQRAVLAQQRAVQRAERTVEESLHKLREIAGEVKVHEGRKEQWLAEQRREEQRREQKRIEEVSQAMHERRRRQDS